MDEEKIDKLAKVLSKQIDKEIFERKYAPIREVLKLVGAGAFLAATIAIPNLPLALKPFLNYKRKNEMKAWKRFNIPYLKRAIQRLEKQKLVEIDVQDGIQIVKITNQGRQKIIKFALDELEIKKPKIWDRKWRLISFDLPEKLVRIRKILVEYLIAWGFYPLHKSVYLHVYPCLKEVDFLREYLGVSKYIRVFVVSTVENDEIFKDYFGV
ncbi:hypothetical protein HYT18_04415 [Candidatus Microgenomates bacterium]|nr:hypothetical protein [Candidatus Microgenomates bacterium]